MHADPTDTEGTPDDSVGASSGSTSPRDRLIDAGMRAMDELPLAKVIGAPTAEIARTAGVTTGSFFHHFPSAAHFADAVALALLERQVEQIEAVDEMLEALPHQDLLESIRSSLWEVWQVFSVDEAILRRLRCQMIMWAHADQPLHEPTKEMSEVRDILAWNYHQLTATSVHGWDYLLERTGRTVVAPFTSELLATTLTAVLDGLRIRHAVDPDAVPDELYGEIGAAIAAVVTAPKGGRMRVEDIDAPLVNRTSMSPQARSGERRRRETRRRITSATAVMFDDGWETISASEVAERSGVASQTVINLYGSVRGVAASTFARHVADVRAAAEPRATDTDTARQALERVLLALSSAVDSDPGAARALVEERLIAAMRRGSELGDMDIRIEVPLADSLLRSLNQLDLGGMEPLDMASTLINFVLAQSLLRPGRAAEVVELALRLLPSGRD